MLFQWKSLTFSQWPLEEEMPFSIIPHLFIWKSVYGEKKYIGFHKSSSSCAYRIGGWMTHALKEKKNLIVFYISSFWESEKILTSIPPSLFLQPPNPSASPRTNSPPEHCSEISSQGGGGVCDREKMMWACREDALLNRFALSSICMLRAFFLDCFFSHPKEDHEDLKHWKP